MTTKEFVVNKYQTMATSNFSHTKGPIQLSWLNEWVIVIQFSKCQKNIKERPDFNFHAISTYLQNMFLSGFTRTRCRLWRPNHCQLYLPCPVHWELLFRFALKKLTAIVVGHLTETLATDWQVDSKAARVGWLIIGSRCRGTIGQI